MKKILFFDKLDFFSIFLILILKIFFKKIYFRDANNIFKKKKYKNFFEKLNIFWISHLNLDCKYYNQSIAIRRDLEKKFIKNQIEKSYLTKIFLNEFKLDENKLKKYYLCLRGELLYQGDFLFESSSLTLINKLLSKNDINIIYFPKDITSYLLACEYKNLKIKISSVYCFYSLFYKILSRLYDYFLRNIENIFNFKKSKNLKLKSSNKKIDFSDFNFAYFPHKGLRYGNAYNKTFIYKNNPSSALYKKKILTLFFNETDEVSLRFMKIHDIPNINLNNVISKKKSLKKTISFYLKNFTLSIFAKNLNLRGLFTLNFHFNFLFTFFKYLDFLEKCKNLKVIYSAYDVLFPKTFKLACEIRFIKTISHQERLYHYSFFSPLFYNYYFVSGEFKNLLPKYDYIIDDGYIDMGVMRSNLITSNTSHRVKKELIRLKKIKNEKKVILCVGLFALNDHEAGIIGEDGTSIKSNIDFVNTILKLSKKFEKFYFLIRFKDNKTKKNLPQKILEEIKNSFNIEINDNEKVNIYQLSEISDFIIGKQTSLMEESIAASKKVVFYDNENHFNSLDYILNKYDLSEKDYLGLESRLTKLLKGNEINESEKENSLSKYIEVNDKLNSYKIISNSLEEILTK